MALSFLDINNNNGLRSQLAKGFKGKLLVGVLTRTENGVPDDNGVPSTTEAKYRVEGFVDHYTAFYRKSAGIPEHDVNVVLISGNCDVNPIKGDKVKFPNYKKYQVRDLKSDPALAVFECQSFEVK